MLIESRHGRISGYADSPVMARNRGRKIISVNNISGNPGPERPKNGKYPVRVDQKMFSRRMLSVKCSIYFKLIRQEAEMMKLVDCN